MKIPRASKDIELNKIFRLLYRHFGPRNWWPGETPFEVMVGAVLTQNTSWKNVEKAIANLKRAKVLTPKKIDLLSLPKLASLLRPSGYFRLKARRLKSLVFWYLEHYEGRIENLARTPLRQARESLLQVWGVGPETADSILCYAAGHESFVVDLYTKRLLARHGILPEKSSYEEMKNYFEGRLVKRNSIYNEFHAQIVAVGNRYCKPEPNCESCPLKTLLPPEGPRRS